MPSFDLSELETRAEQILESNPDPLVEWKVLTDVLRLDGRSSRVREARSRVDTSRWIGELSEDQRADGSWGRFHTADTKVHQTIPTTEAGITRAATLGLPDDHPITNGVLSYLTDLLAGRALFPDPPERNARWQLGVLLFTTSALARLAPDHPMLDKSWSVWSRIVAQTFESGAFNRKAETEAYKDIAGLNGSLGYLQIRNRYTVALVGARAGGLPTEIERAYSAWLWDSDRGLGYLGIDPSVPPDQLGKALDRWLLTHEHLARFPSWPSIAVETIEALWQSSRDDGLWDFGPRADAYNLHLSEHWRRREHRVHDHSVRILALLRHVFSNSD